MDKSILQEYVDSCELIKDMEKKIRRLEQKRNTMIHGVVKGSNHEFPYTERLFKIGGVEFSAADDVRLRMEEETLRKCRENAEKVKAQVEEWLLTVPMRMQRIIRYRYIEELSWQQIANKMGRKATADSVRKELERFFEEK